MYVCMYDTYIHIFTFYMYNILWLDTFMGVCTHVAYVRLPFQPDHVLEYWT